MKTIMGHADMFASASAIEGQTLTIKAHVAGDAKNAIITSFGTWRKNMRVSATKTMEATSEKIGSWCVFG